MVAAEEDVRGKLLAWEAALDTVAGLELLFLAGVLDAVALDELVAALLAVPPTELELLGGITIPPVDEPEELIWADDETWLAGVDDTPAPNDELATPPERLLAGELLARVSALDEASATIDEDEAPGIGFSPPGPVLDGFLPPPPPPPPPQAVSTTLMDNTHRARNALTVKFSMFCLSIMVVYFGCFMRQNYINDAKLNYDLMRHEMLF